MNLPAPQRQDDRLDPIENFNEIRECKWQLMNDAEMLVREVRNFAQSSCYTQKKDSENRAACQKLQEADGSLAFPDPGTRCLAFAVGICLTGFYDHDQHHRRTTSCRNLIEQFIGHQCKLWSAYQHTQAGKIVCCVRILWKCAKAPWRHICFIFGIIKLWPVTILMKHEVLAS